MSLLMTVICSILTITTSQGDWHSLLKGAAIVNFLQFLSTIIPITYPRWMFSYSGYPSDGLQLLRLFKS